jgi:glucose dehydrogenase
MNDIVASVAAQRGGAGESKSAQVHTSMTWINRIFSALLVLMGLGLSLGGIYLATLGGSLYYVSAGLAYLTAGILLWRRQARAIWLPVLVAVLTIPWALWESGTFYWALFPRLLVPWALASLGLLLLPQELPEASRGTMRGLGVLALLGTMAFFGLAFVPHGVFSPGPNSPYTPAAANTTPSDWYAYGRTTAGTRYAAFTQISRDNEARLDLPHGREDFAGDECRRFEYRRSPTAAIRTTCEALPESCGDPSYSLMANHR